MSTLNSDNQLNIKLLKQKAAEYYPDSRIQADLLVAQAILESNLLGARPSLLSMKYNNLFGIKGKGSKGSAVLLTKEQEKSGIVSVRQGFAWYKDIEESIAARDRLLNNGTKDNPNRYHPVLTAPTFEEAARALVKAGYATDFSYAVKLINIYKKYLKKD